METKHIKKEWTAQNNINYHSIVTEDHDVICEIPHNVDISSKDADAIANFIATAPDLLKALKSIESRTALLQKGVNKAGDKQISEVWTIASEAIKKATE